jgi:hypothetical protein
MTRTSRTVYAALILLAGMVLVGWSAYRMSVVAAPLASRGGGCCPPETAPYDLGWVVGFAVLFAGSILGRATFLGAGFLLFFPAFGVGCLVAGFTLPAGMRDTALEMAFWFLGPVLLILAIWAGAGTLRLLRRFGR